MKESAIHTVSSADEVRIVVLGESRAVTVSAKRILELYEADKAGLFGERQPEHGRLSEDSLVLLRKWLRVTHEIARYDELARGNGSITGGLGRSAAEDVAELVVRRRHLQRSLWAATENAGPPVPAADAGTAELDKATAAKIANLHGGDQECGHSLADKILVELLDLLGFRETTKAFIELPKWYA